MMHLKTALTAIIVPIAGQGLSAQSSDVPPVATGVSALSAQLTLPAPSPVLQEEALDVLESAIQRWTEGDHRYSAHVVDSVLARVEALSDLRPLLVAELLVPTGDTAAVRTALESVDRAGELWSRWGWNVAVEAAEAAGDLEAAARAARAQAEVERSPSRAAGAWLRAGRLALELGDSVSAREDLWAALDYGPSFGSARQAAVLIDDASWTAGPGEDLRLGRALLAGSRWERGHDRLRPYLDEGGEVAAIDDELRVDFSRSLFELGRFAEAESRFSQLHSGTVSPEVLSAALYWSGRSQLQRGAPAEALETFRSLASSFPDSRFAEDGLMLLLSRELETGFGPRARGLLDELLEVALRDADTGATVVRLGTTEYLAQDYLAAAELFERYGSASRSASGRQQAWYWAALAHSRAGDAPASEALLVRAHAEDPVSFYGVFAGEQIGAPVLPADLAAGPPPTTGLDTELRNALFRLHVTRLVPTPGSFDFELDRLTEHFARHPNGRYAFAEALVEGGFPLQAIVTGRDIHADEDEWNLRLLRIVHPLPHRETLVRLASAEGLDPFFVAGLIRQESAFDARIRSVAGAVGLMQLMPPTAREVSGNLGMEYAPELLVDPEINLRLGTSYLAAMTRMFERPEDVLAAYNAGPGRMGQWRRLSTYGDRDVFVEHIPFDETREYVRRVQGYARIYSALYGCDDFDPCLGLDYSEIVAQSPIAGGVPRTERTLD